MNWTGGTRVRHNRPSSDTTRLQKRYFAKVRAQNSIHAFSHVATSISDEEGPDSSRGKRKKAAVPTLDIVFSRADDVSNRAEKRRKLLETSSIARTSTPPSSALFLGGGKPGDNELKTKKQLLLEKDDWVCTTLAKPLILRHQAGDSKGCKRATSAKILEPLGLDLREPFTAPSDIYQARGTRTEAEEHNFTPLGKTYANTRKNRGRRFGGVFHNLSDGGYVQIGGSTQPTIRTTNTQNFSERGSVIREMSNISEETMLFDLDSPREGHGTLFRPLSSAACIPESNEDSVFERQYQLTHVQDGIGDMIRYKGGSRWESQDGGGRFTGEFPSSPLAPYSQNVNHQALPNSSDSLADQISELVEDSIGKAEATANIASSSPSTVLSTIYLRPDQPHINSYSGVHLPSTVESDQENTEYKTISHNRYQIHRKYPTLGRSRETLGGLNRLLLGESENTQNLSLMACASSSGSSSVGDSGEGENWMLGSNISPRPQEVFEARTKTPPQASSDDWGNLLGNDIPNQGTNTERDMKDDVEKYLEGVGIWEKQQNDDDEVVADDRCDYSEEEEYEDLNNYGCDPAPVADISNIIEEKGSVSSSDAAPSGFFLWPDEVGKDVPQKYLVTGPSNKLGAEDSSQENPPLALKQKIVNHSKESAGAVIEIMQDLITPDKPEEAITKTLAPILDLDGEEDRAWRMFVFDGLDDNPDDENTKTPERSKAALARKSSLKRISRLMKSASPEPELPNNFRNSDSAYDLDVQSTAGATAGSGSILSSDNYATSSSPVKSKSKYFISSSSPLASPVSLIRTGPEQLANGSGRRGEKRPITFWLGRNSRNGKMTKSRGAGEERKEKDEGHDEIDEIEEW